MATLVCVTIVPYVLIRELRLTSLLPRNPPSLKPGGVDLGALRLSGFALLLFLTPAHLKPGLICNPPSLSLSSRLWLGMLGQPGVHPRFALNHLL
jgi:hypothetical protein